MHATYKRSEIRTALKFFTARLKDRGWWQSLQYSEGQWLSTTVLPSGKILIKSKDRRKTFLANQRLRFFFPLLNLLQKGTGTPWRTEEWGVAPLSRWFGPREASVVLRIQPGSRLRSRENLSSEIKKTKQNKNQKRKEIKTQPQNCCVWIH
jgi:hypothetical protein